MFLKQYVKHPLAKIYILVFLIFFVPRVINLGSDIANYDSSYWYPRMDEFTKHLLRGDYEKTYQKYHPGVVLLWTSGTSKYVFEQTFEAVFDYNPRHIPHQFTRLHFASKLPLVLMISFIGLALFYLISKITNTTYGIIFSIILSLEPFFLGVSRFLHLSALTSMFMFLSFMLLFYHYYKKPDGKKYFYLSAITLGLGLLTKIDAAIAGVVNGVLIIYFEWIHESSNLKQKLWTITKNLLIYGVIVGFIFYILFPAMWVIPLTTLNKIVSEGIKDTAFSSSGAPTLSGIKALYYPEMIVFRSLPVYSIGTVIGLGLFIYAFFRKKKHKSFSINIDQKLLGWVLFYLIVNILLLTIPDKIKDRYVINLYPALSVFVAFFVYHAYKSKHKIYKYSVILLFAFSYILMIYKYHPVYSFYYSELIGGPGGREKLDLPVKNRGEFYAQAALYINKNDSQPEVRNVVLSHREQVRTFAPFFLGETFTNPGIMKNDYFADYIITRPDFEYLIPKDNCKLLKAFGPREPLGYTIVRLYKCEGIDNSYKDFKN